MDNEHINNTDTNNYDDVRNPDKVIEEQLLQDTRSDYEKQMDEAMFLSIQEFKKQKENNKKYEDELIAEHIKIISDRKNLFKGFLFDLHKLIKFDKEIKQIYEIIEPIIDYYCAQHITHWEIDAETYDRIFKVICNIRTDKNNIELLKKILVIHENTNSNKIY